MHTLQQKDERTKAFMDYIQKSQLPQNEMLTTEILASSHNFIIHKEVLVRINNDPRAPTKYLIVIPAALQPSVMQYFHAKASVGAHMSLAKCIDALKRNFYWEKKCQIISKRSLKCVTFALSRKIEQQQQNNP